MELSELDLNAEESVCLEDFNGRDSVGPTSFSADFYPRLGLVVYTGDWDSVKPIPPRPSIEPPAREQVFEWAHSHGSGWPIPDESED